MKPPAHTRHSIFLVLAIIAVLSGFVIFYRFAAIPQSTTLDEIEFTKLALSLKGRAYAPYSTLATGHATLYFYTILLSLQSFGVNLFGLRFPSALFGLLSVLIFFLVLYKSLKKISTIHSPYLRYLVAILGTFLFATTRWYFNFARFGFEGTFVLFLELCSLLCLLFYMDHRHQLWLVPTGIFAGLAYNSYQPGRIFFVIPLVLLFLFVLERKNTRLDFDFFSKRTVTMFVLFLIPFLVTIAPLTYYLSHHEDIRVYQQFYPANHEMTIGEKLQFFGRNVSSTLLMFAVKGDVNGRHNYPNKPALNLGVNILFVMGLLLALKHYKDKINQLFLLYFVLALIPTLFTYPWENPNMLRTITVIPSIMYFAAYALSTLYMYIERKWKIHYLILTILLFCVVSASALYDLRTYFVFQVPVFKDAFDAHQPLNYYIEHPNAPIKN